MGKYIKKNTKCRRTRAMEIKTFGKLEVSGFTEGSRNNVDCICSCGKTLQTNVHNLLKNLKTSCGCSPEPEKVLSVGDVLESNNHGKYKVLAINGYSEVVVEFITTGTIKTVTKTAALNNGITDRLYPSVHGVGCLGYGRYKSRVNNSKSKTPEYRCWENMMSRCYYPQASRYEAYGGKGVTVCEEWLNFQNFAEWFEDNYQEGFDLDKDILGDGTEYSPDVCRFIPQSLNKALTLSPTKLGRRDNNYPEGVYFDKRRLTFVARFGKYYLEEFNCVHKAGKAYSKFKTDYIRKLVIGLFLSGDLCEDVYEVLINYNAEEGHK